MHAKRTRSVLFLCSLAVGCAASHEPSFNGVDASSGRTLALRRAALTDLDAFEGHYHSPQLGALSLARNRSATGIDTIEGRYEHAHTGCAMRGRLRGEPRGNELSFRLVEWSTDTRAGCRDLGELRGRGVLFLDLPRTQGTPAQLFGTRHFERPLEWANPNVDRFGERTISAVRIDPKLVSTHRVPVAPPAASCESNPHAAGRARCGLVPHLPVKHAEQTQLRIDALTNALGLARMRLEAACALDRCDRNGPPWQAAFVALDDAEHFLLIVQEAGDAYARGDGRALDAARACLAARLTRLLEALRAAGQPDVEGVRELWPSARDAVCTDSDPFPLRDQLQAKETPIPK